MHVCHIRNNSARDHCCHIVTVTVRALLCFRCDYIRKQKKKTDRICGRLIAMRKAQLAICLYRRIISLSRNKLMVLSNGCLNVLDLNSPVNNKIIYVDVLYSHAHTHTMSMKCYAHRAITWSICALFCYKFPCVYRMYVVNCGCLLLLHNLY